ncbi:putative CRAL-TRIO lipid binding domain, tubulin-tyrosine ligase/Tubulin polyglutamylase [Plasmopara halstedii]
METFLHQHQAQLVAAQVPERLWPMAYYKLKHEVFDAGDFFYLARDLDGEFRAVVRDDVDLARMQPDSDEAIFLVDHAWTFTADKIREQLTAVPKLLDRMEKMMQLKGLDKNERVDAVADRVWRNANTYRLGNAKPEDASSICGDFLSRDYFPEFASDVVMHTALLTALFYEPGTVDSPHLIELEKSIAARKKQDTLENARARFYNSVSRDSETPPYPETPVASVLLSTIVTKSGPLRICSDSKLMHTHLTHPHFTLVDNEDEAQVVWLTRHLKDFPKYTTNDNVQIINQFPNEKILTCKDLLYEVCKLQNGGVRPNWLAETYNMTSELPELISQFIQRDLVARRNGNGYDEANYWICKPWNMARSIDTCIAQNAPHIARLAETGPKIACKYIHRPLLIDQRKFDIRFLVMVKSTEPLELYLSGVYWLRIANKEFTMDNFHDFEKHFTVMNYSDFAVRIMDNSEFIERFESEYPSENWATMFIDICTSIKQMFEFATAQPPPLGLGRCTKSRALYGVDIMLSWEADEETGSERLRPIILETNFQPDCTRACKYFPHFYNDLMNVLLLDRPDETVHGCTLMDAHILRYGQKVRLATYSAYIEDNTVAVLDSGIGFYEKNGRHGILSCVPPLGPKLQQLFTEDEFLVLHPSDQRSHGENVLYGEPLVLVNQHGMVWNNKTGGITGYVGPRPRGVPGEIFVCFTKVPEGVGVIKSSKKDKVNKVERSTIRASFSASSTSDKLSMSEYPETESSPVYFGDTNVAITVVESNRHSQMFNKRLSNFKKPTSRIVGGYICCDGRGTELRFSIWPTKPKIEQISMLNKLITSYQYGQKIALPSALLMSMAKRTDDANVGIKKMADILFRLSNGAEAMLSGAVLHSKVQQHAKPLRSNQDEHESVFELPLRNGPGMLVVQLTGTAPLTVTESFTATNESHRLVPKVKSSTVLFYRVSDVLRRVPVSIFAISYAVLTHYLWGALSTMEDGFCRELVVFVLVILPALYAAVKMDHPFSALFQPPVHEPEVVNDNDYSSPTTNGTLKLIVTEYRFVSGPLKGSCTNGRISRLSLSNVTTSTNEHSITALEATGSVPMRFILAEKGDEAKALERYNETTEWRRAQGVDLLLEKPSPHFNIIKENYPHYYHKRGKKGEPVYYEKPGMINLNALKNAGLTLDDLMHNYLVITEFLWQVIEQDDNCKGISVLDVEGIGISDFAGEAVEYVRKAASVSSRHYPERCAYIYVINVPSWFSVIWNTVKGMVDDVTREKVIIVRGKKKILEALSERIPVENIPVEYGGTSNGTSEEEDLLFKLMAHVNSVEGTSDTNPIEDILKRKPIKH